LFILSNSEKIENGLRFDEVKGEIVTGSHFFAPLCILHLALMSRMTVDAVSLARMLQRQRHKAI